MKKVLIYDTEIQNCIPDKYGNNNSNYRYCQEWEDHKGMGVACVAVWTSWNGYHVFLESNLTEFQKLVDEAETVISFNGISFDDRLLTANGIRIKTNYDLLCEARVASGEPPHYVRGVTRAGYALEPLAKANLGRGKSGTGELAPILWQDKCYRQIIDYCLNDIELLRELWERRSALIDPTNDKILFLRGGSRWEWFKAVVAKWWLALKESWKNSDWWVFLWAIARSDISSCYIRIIPPIKFEWWRGYQNRSILTLPRLKARGILASSPDLGEAAAFLPEATSGRVGGLRTMFSLSGSVFIEFPKTISGADITANISGDVRDIGDCQRPHPNYRLRSLQTLPLAGFNTALYR